MLVTDILTLKKYVPLVMGSDFDRYSFYMGTADTWLINELIGQDLYDLIAADEFDDTKLFEYCQSISANKGYLDAIPMLDLVETETGFAVTSNANLAPASRERVNALTAGIEKSLSAVIELMLEYLEGNEDYYDAWKGAKTYTINHDSFIFTLTQFRRYARYDGSRLEFIKDMPRVTRAIRYRIEPIISKEQSTEIILQLQDDDLNEANKNIIEDLRMSLAAFVTGDEVTGLNSLFKARKTMLANVDDYPEFKASDIYVTLQAQTDTFSVEHPFMNCGV